MSLSDNAPPLPSEVLGWTVNRPPIPAVVERFREQLAFWQAHLADVIEGRDWADIDWPEAMRTVHHVYVVEVELAHELGEPLPTAADSATRALLG